jgi:hypothetical protein
VDTYRFIAHPGIRQETEIVATQPIERKRTFIRSNFDNANSLGTSLSKSPKVANIPPEFLRGVACKAPAAMLSGASQPGDPLLNGAFPEAGCHVFPVVALLRNRVDDSLSKASLPTWRIVPIR